MTNSRRKGAAFEVEIAHRITEALGEKWERNILETRTGNVIGDCVPHPSVEDPAPLRFQLKVGARPPIYRAVEEVVSVTPPGHHPIAIVRRNQKKGQKRSDLLITPLEDGLEILSLLRRFVWR